MIKKKNNTGIFVMSRETGRYFLISSKLSGYMRAKSKTKTSVVTLDYLLLRRSIYCKTINTRVCRCATGLGTIHNERQTRCGLLFNGFHSEGVLVAGLAGHAPGVRPPGRLQGAVQMGRRSVGAESPARQRYVRPVDASIRRAQ